jgi:hypothetical protein
VPIQTTTPMPIFFSQESALALIAGSEQQMEGGISIGHIWNAVDCSFHLS